MFSNQTVLLTGVGAPGQVGEAVAAAFGTLGASLVLVDRTLDHVQARARDLEARGYRASPYACDLSDASAVGTLAEQVRADHGGRLRALVHLAGGFAMSGPVADSAVDVWTRQLTINLTTAYLTARAFIPLLRGGGAMVFFASEAVLPGGSSANRTAYTVAKQGVVTLMRGIAAEERDNGLRANAVAPISIRTAANVAAMGEGVRYVERERVADVETVLCSEQASAINGALVPIT
jgi:NAD(P)-dependent dehydrogenase (short-subunit alcohol dehydrogenase family)